MDLAVLNLPPQMVAQDGLEAIAAISQGQLGNLVLALSERYPLGHGGSYGHGV
jgi:hypothetical protein